MNCGSYDAGMVPGTENLTWLFFWSSVRARRLSWALWKDRRASLFSPIRPISLPLLTDIHSRQRANQPTNCCPARHSLLAQDVQGAVVGAFLVAYFVLVPSNHPCSILTLILHQNSQEAKTCDVYCNLGLRYVWQTGSGDWAG